MKMISLKIDDDIFSETEKILSSKKQARNRYINEAIAHYNQLQRRIQLSDQLKKESEWIAADSMQTLQDFENLDYTE